MVDKQSVIIVLLLLALLMLAWVIGTALAIHRDIAPIVNSDIVRAVSGVHT